MTDYQTVFDSFVRRVFDLLDLLASIDEQVATGRLKCTQQPLQQFLLGAIVPTLSTMLMMIGTVGIKAAFTCSLCAIVDHVPDIRQSTIAATLTQWHQSR